MLSKEIVKLEKKLLEYSYSKIFPINDVPVFKFIGDRHDYRFYTVLPKFKVTVINNINKLSNTEIKQNYSFHVLENKKVFLLFNNEGVYDVLQHLKSEFKNDDFLDIELDLAICNHNRDSSINNCYIKKYQTYIENTKNGFILNYCITPKTAIFGTPPKTYKLPKVLQKPYTKEKIIITPKGTIASVQLIGQMQHPNCDKDGYYCLGDLSDMKVNDTTLDVLISSIKVFNLNSCYYIPDKMVKLLEE